MSEIDLESLSLEKLQSLQIELTNLIEEKKVEAQDSLLSEFKERATALGLDLDEIMGTTTQKKTRAKVLPKYKDPNDSEVTWTGRGRKPLWVVQQLENGKSLEQLKI